MLMQIFSPTFGYWSFKQNPRKPMNFGLLSIDEIKVNSTTLGQQL